MARGGRIERRGQGGERPLDDLGGPVLEQHGVLDAAPRDRPVVREVGPQLQVAVERRDRHPVSGMEHTQHARRFVDHAQQARRARRVQVLLEEEDDQPPGRDFVGSDHRGVLGREAFGVGRRGVDPERGLHGNRAAVHLDAEVRGLEVRPGLTAPVEDARVEQHALHVHPFPEARLLLAQQQRGGRSQRDESDDRRHGICPPRVAPRQSIRLRSPCAPTGCRRPAPSAPPPSRGRGRRASSPPASPGSSRRSGARAGDVGCRP